MPKKASPFERDSSVRKKRLLISCGASNLLFPGVRMAMKPYYAQQMLGSGMASGGDHADLPCVRLLHVHLRSLRPPHPRRYHSHYRDAQQPSLLPRSTRSCQAVSDQGARRSILEEMTLSKIERIRLYISDRGSAYVRIVVYVSCETKNHGFLTDLATVIC